VCGVVLSIRTTVDTISLWNSNADDATAVEKCTVELSELLSLQNNPNVNLEYKPHQVSLDFNKSLLSNSGKRLSIPKRRSSSSLHTLSSSSPRKSLDSSDGFYDTEKSPRMRTGSSIPYELPRSYSTPTVHRPSPRLTSPEPGTNNNNNPANMENTANPLSNSNNNNNSNNNSNDKKAQGSGKKRRHARRHTGSVDSPATDMNSAPIRRPSVKEPIISTTYGDTTKPKSQRNSSSVGVIQPSPSPIVVSTVPTQPLASSPTITIGSYSTTVLLKKPKRAMSIAEIGACVVLLLSLLLGLAFISSTLINKNFSPIVRLF